MFPSPALSRPRLPAAAAAALAVLLMSLAAALLAPSAAPAADAQAEDPLAEYLWVARPIVIFANAEQDPRLVRQLAELDSVETELEERDVVVIVDATPGRSRSDTTPLRKMFRPHGFNLLLIGKDGEVKKRSPRVVSGSQLVRQIDRLPLRQQEIGR